jgi:hypothetical protein
MTKKILALTDYITAREAAHMLTLKQGRPISPDYIRKLRHVHTYRLNSHSKLYCRADIEQITIRRHKAV